MALETKTVTCQCGATYQIAKPVHWCTACGRQVFYSERLRRRQKLNTYYLYGVIAIVFTFLTYVFIELIVTPLLKG